MRKGQPMPEAGRKKVRAKIVQLYQEGKLSKDKGYKKGQEPWNKGLSVHLNPKTEFKVDQFVGDAHPNWRGGIQKTKDDGVYLWIGKYKRMRRARAIYEKVHGKISKGEVIFHIDKDMNNDAIDNLEAISRAELLKRNLIG